MDDSPTWCFKCDAESGIKVVSSLAFDMMGDAKRDKWCQRPLCVACRRCVACGAESLVLDFARTGLCIGCAEFCGTCHTFHHKDDDFQSAVDGYLDTPLCKNICCACEAAPPVVRHPRLNHWYCRQCVLKGKTGACGFFDDVDPREDYSPSVWEQLKRESEEATSTNGA